MRNRCVIIGLFVCMVTPLIGDDYVDDIYFLPEKALHMQADQLSPRYNPRLVEELEMQLPTDTAVIETDSIIIYHPI